MSDVKDSPPPPKKAKKGPKSEAKTDEELAREMQDELNRVGARATRGGATKKKPAVKAKKIKKKSAAKIRSEDDSEVDDGDSSGDKPEKEKKGGFHVRSHPSYPSLDHILTLHVQQKPMNLSQPLIDLLGEPQLSRPQTVKRIWAYVKERDLQDPSDKRQIRCDDLLRAVFKSDRIHMFTMNKVLATQLYPADE